MYVGFHFIQSYYLLNRTYIVLNSESSPSASMHAPIDEDVQIFWFEDEESLKILSYSVGNRGWVLSRIVALIWFPGWFMYGFSAHRRDVKTQRRPLKLLLFCPWCTTHPGRWLGQWHHAQRFSDIYPTSAQSYMMTDCWAGRHLNSGFHRLRLSIQVTGDHLVKRSTQIDFS